VCVVCSLKTRERVRRLSPNFQDSPRAPGDGLKCKKNFVVLCKGPENWVGRFEGVLVDNSCQV